MIEDDPKVTTSLWLEKLSNSLPIKEIKSLIETHATTSQILMKEF